MVWCSSRQREELPTSSAHFGDSSVDHSLVVRDLGVWIDRGLTLSTHVMKAVASCFATLRQLCPVFQIQVQVALESTDTVLLHCNTEFGSTLHIFLHELRRKII